VSDGVRVALVGPTAAGKSAAALALADSVPTVELISADSMCVYKGMDVGTAKPDAEERLRGRYHLIDVADPSEEWSVARHVSEAERVLADLEACGHQALFVGGTGLYVRALTDGLTIPPRFPELATALWSSLDTGERRTGELYRWLERLDPAAARRIDPRNARRLVRALEVCLGSGRPFSSFGPGLDVYAPSERVHLVGLDPGIEAVDEAIARRWRAQLEAGLVDEVRRLARRSRPLSATARRALGYQQVLACLAGEISLEEASRQALSAIRRFARRQRSWFRRDPRVQWVSTVREAVDVLCGLLGGERRWSDGKLEQAV
jgi:tRNA dimethylallyltransferase